MTVVSSEVVLVTPELASSLLRKVRNQGRVDQKQVAAYADDMRAGKWKVNGEPLIVSESGELLAGRLRLAACVMAKVPFKSLIINGVDGSSYETIDALRRRQVADIMSIKKEPHGRALAAGLAVLWRYSNNELHNQSRKISAQALLCILDKNPEIRTSILLTKILAPTFPHGATAAMHYLFSCVDSQACFRFFSELETMQPENGPTWLLKRQVENLASTGGRRNQAQLLAIMIKAWEAFRCSKPISQLRYSPAADRFPEITGLPANIDLDGNAGNSQVAQHVERHDHELSVSVQQISPKRAEEILASNSGNRTATRGVIEKYARDMLAGKWMLNGQTIKIGKSGRLLDGQHRLMAAIKANTAFTAVIVQGLDEAVFDTFDLGTRRSLSDILKDRGETYTATLAAALRQLWIIDNGYVQARTISPTVAELIVELEKHPDIRDSVKWSGKIRDTIATSFGCALHYLFSRVDLSLANQFMDRLADGSNLTSDSPILKLRNLLQKDKGSRNKKMSDQEKIAITIKAWNAFYLGRKMGALKWQMMGDKPEAFPAIAGREASAAQEAA